MSRFKKGLSQICFLRGTPLSKIFSVAQASGFDGVELRLSEKGEFSLESGDSDIDNIKRMAKEHGLEICSIVGGLQWKYPLTSPDPTIRERGISAAKKAVEFAAKLEAGAVLIVPAVVTSEVSYDKAWALAVDALLEIAKVAEKLDVLLAVENVWNKFIFTPFEMNRFVDEINSKLTKKIVGVYFDVGNVVLFGYPEQWVRILKEKIKRIHIKDFKIGDGPAHFTFPFSGSVDWKAVMEAVVEVGYTGYLTAEIPIPALAMGSTAKYISMLIDDILKLAS